MLPSSPMDEFGFPRKAYANPLSYIKVQTGKCCVKDDSVLSNAPVLNRVCFYRCFQASGTDLLRTE